MLTFEGTQHQGPANISQKLQSLSFQTVQHQLTTVDCQPSPNGVVIFVCGDLCVDGNAQQPLKFSQVFQLAPFPNGAGYWVLNDMFRINIGCALASLPLCRATWT